MIINRTLNCGVRMVMEKIPYVQSAAVGIWTKAGAVDESPELAGISHFIEHMLFKGTEKRSAKQIAEDIDKIGGQINAFTSKESTCYYVKSLSANLEKACDVLVDMYCNSVFDEGEMQKEKNVVIEEIKMVEDTPEDDAHDMVYEVMFQDQPLSKSILGIVETLTSITGESIRSYMREEYTRDSIVISVCGNFDEDQVCAFFEGKLSHLAAAKAAKPHRVLPYQPHYRMKVKEIEQSHLCLATKGIRINDPQYYAMAVLNNIMGGSMSSRLFQNIREEKGMAYSVYSYSSSYVHDGFYGIYAGVSHDKVGDTVEAIKEELAILKAKGVTEEELEISKEQLKGSYIFGLESVSGRMASIGKSKLLIDKVYTPEEVLQKIDSINMQDMDQVAAQITDINNYSSVLLSRREYDLKGLLLG